MKILFAHNIMYAGGTEKSLINLTHLLLNRFQNIEIDLVLMGAFGPFLELLNKRINIIDLRLECPQEGIVKRIIKKAKKIIFKRAVNDEAWYKKLPVIEKQYDVAVSYSVYFPKVFCYVVDKVKATKKLVWVHENIRPESGSKFNEQYKIYKGYINSYDEIVVVSEFQKEYLESWLFNHNGSCDDSLRTITDIKSKVTIAKNYIVETEIIEQGNCEFSWEDDFHGFRVVTVGTVEYRKGTDLAIEAAKLLKEKHIDFKWYFIGHNGWHKECGKLINKYDLSDSVYLIGAQTNPYKYIKNCDVYCQTSRAESYCLTVAEARILKKPIVSTPFIPIESQITNGFDGLISDSFEPRDIAECLYKVICDPKLRGMLSANTYYENDTKKLLNLFTI